MKIKPGRCYSYWSGPVTYTEAIVLALSEPWIDHGTPRVRALLLYCCDESNFYNNFYKPGDIVNPLVAILRPL